MVAITMKELARFSFLTGIDSPGTIVWNVTTLIFLDKIAKPTN
jgi:hypothetical protein